LINGNPQRCCGSNCTQLAGRLATVPWRKGVCMLPEAKIRELYNDYKAEYEQLKGKSDSNVGYVSRRVMVKWIIELFEEILNGDK